MPAIQNNLCKISDLLKAMSNDQRLKVICALRKGEKTVTELQDVVDVTQSALSQHLGCLRDQKIVQTRRHGQKVYYSLAKGPCLTVLSCLNDIYTVEGSGPDGFGNPIQMSVY